MFLLLLLIALSPLLWRLFYFYPFFDWLQRRTSLTVKQRTGIMVAVYFVPLIVGLLILDAQCSHLPRAPKPAAYTSLNPPETPPPTPRFQPPPPSTANTPDSLLAAEYSRLTRLRDALDARDPVAVQSFNSQVAAYHDRLHELQRAAGTANAR